MNGPNSTVRDPANQSSNPTIAAAIVAHEQAANPHPSYLRNAGVPADGTGLNGVIPIESPAAWKKLILPIVALAIPVTTHGAAGAQGGVDIFQFGQGNVLIGGAVLSGVAAVSNNYNGLIGAISLGTAVAGVNNATLTSTESNVIPETGVDWQNPNTLLSALSTGIAIVNDVSAVVKLWLNIAFSNDETSESGTVTITGTITVYYLNLSGN